MRGAWREKDETMSHPETSPLPDQPDQPDHRPHRPHECPAAQAHPAGDLDHPVVVGFDGSPPSRHALAYAAGLSRRLHRPLLVVHVSPPSVYCEPVTGHAVPTVGEPAEEEGWLMSELAAVCDCEGLDIHVVTRRGSPARELAAAAEAASADALVIGAPGHRWHQVAGSVSGWLARHARCPVVVVP
jgi:nucleotide-binding universal stress UspA family protein